MYKVNTNSCAIVYENNTVTLHHVCSEFGMCFILTVTTIHGQGRRVTEEGSTSPEGDQCPICFAVYLAESAVDTDCGHTFCWQCIVNVLKASQPLWLAKCPCCRQTISPFSMVCSGQKLVEYPTTIFGGVYIQCNMESLASYHFKEEESYILYSAAPPYWHLDDGSPPPVRKPFLNSSCIQHGHKDF